LYGFVGEVISNLGMRCMLLLKFDFNPGSCIHYISETILSLCVNDLETSFPSSLRRIRKFSWINWTLLV